MPAYADEDRALAHAKHDGVVTSQPGQPGAHREAGMTKQSK